MNERKANSRLRHSVKRARGRWITEMAAVALAGVVAIVMFVLWVVVLVGFCGCRLNSKSQVANSKAAEPPKGGTPYGTRTSVERALPAMQSVTFVVPKTNGRTNWLVWSYEPTNGPVCFEIWRSTNLAAFTAPTGTNAPGGFTLWTNAGSTNRVVIPKDAPAGFFIVRARQTMTGTGFGQVSDWAAK